MHAILPKHFQKLKKISNTFVQKKVRGHSNSHANVFSRLDLRLGQNNKSSENQTSGQGEPALVLPERRGNMSRLTWCNKLKIFLVMCMICAS